MFSLIRNFLFENKNLKQSLIKNTFWLFFGQISGKLLRIALVVFAARKLGPESWGSFSYVMGVVAFMTIFSDLGINAIVTRESAKDRSSSQKYFSTAFFIKIILLTLGSAIFIFGGSYLSKIEEAKILLPIVSLMLIFDGLRNFGFSISRAIEKMQIEAINEVITNILITVFGFYVLKNSPTTLNLTIAYIGGVFLGFLFIAFQLKNYFRNIINALDFNLIKPIIVSSLPFALASFLGAIMINTDMIMLGWMSSPEKIGFYSAAQKPIQVFYTVAALFATSLFPVLSKITKEKERFRSLLEKALTTSLALAIPIALGGIILSNQIINLLYGNAYLPATSAFQILILTVIIIFPSIIVSNSLLAYGEQKEFVWFSLLGALGNLTFNFLLIPLWGIVGCSLSTLITQIIANAFIWKKMKNINYFQILPKMKKVIVASIFSIFLAWIMKNSGINIFVIIAATAIIYGISLKTLKEELLIELLR